MKKNIQLRLFPSMTLLIILFSSCSGDNAAQEDPEAVNTTACKMGPGQIACRTYFKQSLHHNIQYLGKCGESIQIGKQSRAVTLPAGI